MKKQLFISAFFYAALLFMPVELFSQNVGINTTGSTANASSMLDITSTTKGILIPRLTNAQKTAMNPLPVAAQGLMIYQTDGAQGFYYNTSITTTPNWVMLSGGSGWLLTGNGSTVDGTNFIGTTDNIPFNIRVNNQKAGRIDPALSNSFFGYQAGNGTTSGQFSTAVGSQALLSNSSGTENVAVGEQTLKLNTSNWNTAVGRGALLSNTGGNSNTAIGVYSMINSTGGSSNTAVGSQSLAANTGENNTGVGRGALQGNTSGTENTAIGLFALQQMSAGSSNVACGTYAMTAAANFSANTAVGYRALETITKGNNAALGYYAGNFPAGTNTTGTNSLFLGCQASAGVNGLTNATAIGYNAVVNASNALVLGGTGANAVKVGIGTASPAALLDLGLAGTTPGVIRFAGSTSGNVTVMPAPAAGTWTLTLPSTTGTAGQVLSTDGTGICSWITAGSGSSDWGLTGNTGTSAATNFIGTTDNVDFVVKTDGTEKMRVKSGGEIDITNNLALPTTTGATVGVISFGGTRYIHCYGAGNFFAGFGAGNFTMTSSTANTGIGQSSLAALSHGNSNSALGEISLDVLTTGDANTSIGYAAMHSSITSSNNTAVGFQALSGHDNNTNCTIIGGNADVTVNGLFNATAIGYSAKVGANNSLVLGGTGGFAVNVGIGTTTPSYKLDVQGGDINASGSVRSAGVALTSDVRLKKDILDLQNGLNAVMQLRPVSYKKKSSIESNDYSKEEMGFIAQEVQKVFPQLVTEGKDKNKILAIDYNSLIPLLTKAIQEQQKTLENQQVEIDKIKSENDYLKTSSEARITRLESIIENMQSLAAESK